MLRLMLLRLDKASVAGGARPPAADATAACATSTSAPSSCANGEGALPLLDAALHSTSACGVLEVGRRPGLDPRCEAGEGAPCRRTRDGDAEVAGVSQRAGEPRRGRTYPQEKHGRKGYGGVEPPVRLGQLRCSPFGRDCNAAAPVPRFAPGVRPGARREACPATRRRGPSCHDSLREGSGRAGAGPKTGPSATRVTSSD
jgi:hypothetical protein